MQSVKPNENVSLVEDITRILSFAVDDYVAIMTNKTPSKNINLANELSKLGINVKC